MKTTETIESKIVRDDEIDVGAIIKLLFKNTFLIGSISFSFAVCAALYSLYWMEPKYESIAVITPSGGKGMASGLGSGFGGNSLMQLLNFGGAMGEVNQLAKRLESKALIAQLIDRENLLEKLSEPGSAPPEDPELARAQMIKDLSSVFTIEIEGEFVTVSTRNTDPELAHFLVASLLENLRVLIEENVKTSAKATQEFIEQRLAEAEKKLAEVEEEYVAFQTKQGVVELPSQLGLSLGTASELRSRLIEKEMEIALYKDVIRDASEVHQLESEKEQIEKQINDLIAGEKRTSDSTKVEIFTPLQQGASLSFQFANAERRYKVQEKVVELLSQQLELARIETKKQEPKFQVLDPPMVASFPVGPRKKLITAMGGIFGIFLGVVLVLLTNAMRSPPPMMSRIVRVDIERKSAKVA